MTAPADSRPEPMEVSEGVAEGELEGNAAAVPRVAAHAGGMHAVPDGVVERQSGEDSEDSPLGAMQESGGPQSPGLGGQQPGVPSIPRILAAGPGMDGAVFRFGAHGGGNPGLGQVPQQHHQQQHIQHSVLPSSPVPGLSDLNPVHPLAEVPRGGLVPAAALAPLAQQQQQMQQQQVPQSMDEEGRNNGLGGGGGGGVVVPVVPPVSAMVADEPQALVSTAVPAVSSATTMTTTSSSLMSQVYQWRIENFSTTDKKVYSKPPFAVGGYNWRILIFPKGNQGDQLSLYLDVADAQGLPFGWSRFADFTLAVVNQIDRNQTIRKEAKHQFNARESDWGFTAFMPLAELYDTSRGFIVNDTLIVEAEVHVRPDPWAYDSKKETGFVGLKNQGATCYMNSLLQTLYHIPHFRKAVYHMPTTESDNPSNSIPLALQSLFYRLQYSDSGSVATKELTRSFGWDTYDSFMQHDVQELNRVLCEKLEDKMKGTSVEGTIQHLFEGHIMNYIECVNVDFKSTRKESFLDLQLDVKGCKDVYASFDKYTEVEMLTGDNKYHAEQHGLQDARKGVLFLDFPPVLQLQLKRFEYDFERDTMVKINDRYEFPLQLDLDIGNYKYLAPVADKSTRNLYSLHSVLVHSGGVHGGHYYAFIRPTLTDQWYKFDDERVTKEDTKKALDEQFGGEDEMPAAHPPPFKFTKYSNAYMLVYVRDVDRPKILCHVDESDIAEHLQVRLRKEQEEKERKRKEKAEAHLYTIIKVATDEDLRQQIGNHIFFDLVDHDRIDRIHTFRIEKQKKFSEFKEEVARVLGMPVELQRYWLWSKRQNATYRPSRPLTPEEETYSVGKLKEANNKTHTAELKLFLELPQGLMPPQLHPQLQPQLPAANNNTAQQAAQCGGAKHGMAWHVMNFAWRGISRQQHHQQQQQQQQPQQQQQGDQTNQASVVAMSGAAGGPNPNPSMQLEKIKDSILLFFKLYDPRTETVKYVGRLFVRPGSKPIDIIPKLNEMAGFKPDEEILLFEEIKYEPSVMCEPVDKRLSFKASQLEDGDIICFQKAAPDDDEVEGADCKANGTGSQRDTPMTPSPEAAQQQPGPAATAAATGDGLASLPTASADGTVVSSAALGSGRRGRTDGAVPMDADSDSGGDGGAHGAVLRDGGAAQRTAQGPQAMVEDGGPGAAAYGVVAGDAARLVGVLPQRRIRFHDVPSFLEYVRNRQVVHFRRLDKPKEEDFSLELSKQHTYDDVVERVAERVGVDDPSKIRLTMHNVFSQQPKPPAIKYRGVDRLADMLLHFNHTSDILYYEILDMPLPELQQLKTLRMAFHNSRTEEVSVHTLRLPKQSTVADLLAELQGKVELSSPDAELRMFQVFCHKIFKVFPPTEVIDTINDTYLTLRAEEVPEEERVLGPGDRLVNVYHIAPSPASADLNLTVGNPQQQHNNTEQQQPLQQPQPQQQPQQQLFGDPFFLLLRESDTVADLRQRIRKKLQVPDEEFAKWRLAFISANSVQFLEDADVVSPRFQKREPWEHYLGLEHPDANPRRPHQHHNSNQNRHAYERPVKIYN